MSQNYDNVFFVKLFESLMDGVFYVDTQKKIRFINDKALSLAGFSESEVIGKNYHDLFACVGFSDGIICRKRCLFERSVTSRVPFLLETFLNTKNGMKIPVTIRTSPVFDDANKFIGAVSLLYENYSKLKIIKAVKDLKNIAFQDSLTGIANRRYTESSLSSHLSKMRLTNEMFGVLMIDIDNFKNINDTHGHEAGDRVLKDFSLILVNNSRDIDVIGRFGGDEFFVILRYVTEVECKNIAEKFRLLSAENEVDFMGEKIKFTISIGATLSKPEDTIATILRRADNYLYCSKKEGRNRLTLCR